MITLKNKKMKEKVKKTSLIILALFLTYFTVYPFFKEANLRVLGNIYLITIPLLFIYYFILKKIIPLYYKLLEKFISKKNKIKISKQTNNFLYGWSFSIILLGLVSILLYVMFSYYIYKNSNISDMTNYLTIAKNIHLKVFLITILIGLLSGFFLQVMYLVKYEKVKILRALFSSFLTIIIFSFIIYIIRNIFVVILAWV